MEELYNPQQIEQTTQQSWQQEACFEVEESDARPKYYCLSMLPYPSGELHMGHIRNYTLGDVLTQYQRLQGKNVLQPMGWDSFGLPAENAAISRKTPPAKWTQENIQRMRQQLQRMGYAYDWRRELSTCDASYYRWEQWLFCQLYKQGLVYKKKSMVNWDPVDQTVLANEQVIDGCGWRSGAPVERREIAQWFLKITDYADELLAGLDQLPGWPEQVKTMQRNWIGCSEGFELAFTLVANEFSPCTTLTAFSTRAETLYGVPFILLAADHPLTQEIAAQSPQVADFVKQCAQQGTAEAAVATAEKQGIDLGVSVKHPLSGKTIPVWTANYVLMNYGTGCIMAVPAHDQRDHEFASKYQLPIAPVICHPTQSDWDYQQTPYTEAQGTLINSEDFDGQELLAARSAIGERLQALGMGQASTQYRLRDWGISRQRYWGAPIPIIYCKACGTQAVPEADLPVKLPTDVVPDEHGHTLEQCAEFYHTSCPKCGAAAVRETDTMDTFMESSWYFARYCSYDQNQGMLDRRAEYWLPVDLYIGGIEHAILHLLYARFFSKLLCDQKLISHREPFKNLLTQGMVLKDGHKMSKSKGNTVSPVELVKQYGADTIRLFIIFAAPPTQNLEWSDSGVAGAHRFLKKLWRSVWQQSDWLNSDYKSTLDKPKLSQSLIKSRQQLHQLIAQATQDLNKLQLNTVVSAAMKIQNILQDIAKLEQNSLEDATHRHCFHETLGVLLRLLFPITPHLCYNLWNQSGFAQALIAAGWPEADPDALQVTQCLMILQVNGKVRSKITVDPASDDQTLKQLAQQDPQIARHLAGKTIRKIIVVPQRLINIVAN